MSERVTCLCCGSRYRADGDCPNVHRQEHSFDLAAAVARYLLISSREPADPRAVREAIAAVRR